MFSNFYSSTKKKKDFCLWKHIKKKKKTFTLQFRFQFSWPKFQLKKKNKKKCHVIFLCLENGIGFVRNVDSLCVIGKRWNEKNSILRSKERHPFFRKRIFGLTCQTCPTAFSSGWDFKDTIQNLNCMSYVASPF